MHNQAIAQGLSDMIMGTKLALRSVVWFGFGYHQAKQNGTERAYLDEVRAGVLASGKVKSEASARVSQAKALGAVFAERFGAELASEWPSDAHMVQACFLAMTSSGVTSVKKMGDWVKHGDAEHSAKVSQRAADEKRAAAQAESAALIEAATASDALDIDTAPAPAPGPRPQPVVAEEPEAFDLSAMSDEALTSLAKALAAEKAKRKRAARVAA